MAVQEPLPHSLCLCSLSDVSDALYAACVAAICPVTPGTWGPCYQWLNRGTTTQPLLRHRHGKVLLQVPELTLPPAAAVWQLEVPAPQAEAPPQSPAPGGKAAAPAKGAKPAAPGAAAAAAVVETEPPKAPTRWNCKPTVPTPARHVCVVVGALLQLLGGMQKGSVELHAGRCRLCCAAAGCCCISLQSLLGCVCLSQPAHTQACIDTDLASSRPQLCGRNAEPACINLQFAWSTSACYLFHVQSAGLVSCPASKASPLQSQAPASEDDDPLSLGSDALPERWFEKQHEIDMQWCARVALMTLAVLHRQQRHHAVVKVGCLLSSVVAQAFCKAQGGRWPLAKLHWYLSVCSRYQQVAHPVLGVWPQRLCCVLACLPSTAGVCGHKVPVIGHDSQPSSAFRLVRSSTGSLWACSTKPPYLTCCKQPPLQVWTS